MKHTTTRLMAVLTWPCALLLSCRAMAGDLTVDGNLIVTSNSTVHGTLHVPQKVGIGTNAPAAQLHVVGNALVTSNLTVLGAIQGDGAGLTNLNLGQGTTGQLPISAMPGDGFWNAAALDIVAKTLSGDGGGLFNLQGSAVTGQVGHASYADLAGAVTSLSGHDITELNRDASVSFYKDVTAYRKVTIMHLVPQGDIPMGAFTNGPPLYEQGLVLHLPLNGNVEDISGTGHHGTAHDVSFVPGRNGRQAASFNGSTSYVDVRKNGLDDISNYDGPFTISLWLNVPNPVSGVNTGVFSFGGINTGTDQWRCYVSGETFQVYFATDQTNEVVASWPSGWHHVCVVFLNDANRTGIVYVDGANVFEHTAGEYSAGCGTVGNHDPCMRLGGMLSGWASEVPLQLQDVKFFDRALGAGEVAGLAAE